MAIDPVAISIFGLDIHWYGISYAIGFLFALLFIRLYSEYYGLNRERVEDMLFYIMIFSVIGARLFYVIFYNPSHFISNPLDIFMVWKGGMSVHGAIAFGLGTLIYLSKRYKQELLKVTDLFLMPSVLGFAFGRFANFVNQELVGTPTTSSIGVVFPNYDSQTRYPYQIFAGLKNMITFQILFYLFIFKKLKTGTLTGLFLILYSYGRFLIDFIRVPTVDLGLISMGQLLNLIYGTAGIILLIYIYKIKPKKDKEKLKTTEENKKNNHLKKTNNKRKK